MTDRDRYHCRRCDRTFLSKEALDRHYGRNPDHAEQFVIDVDAIESDAATLPGEEWVETDETVETFITVAEPTSAPDSSASDDSAAPESSDAPSNEPSEKSSSEGDEVTGTGGAACIEMTYDPETASLVIHGIRDRELDLSQFWEAVGDKLTWSFDGTYHKIQFYKDDEGR